jgi:LPXTG-motif cell wall-anchored protein
MTPARSLAASVIALGFASSLTAPTPAFAASAPCDRAENFAAQSGAEMLRINRLAWHTSSDLERPSVKSSHSASSSSPSSSSGGSRKESVTDTADDLLSGDVGDSGQGVTGFLSGTGDLLKSITNGGVTAPGAVLSGGGSGGQGGGGPVRSGDSDGSVGGVGLGETKAAMIADARTNAIAVGRIVDGKGSFGKPLIQSAPPNSADNSRHTPSGSAGPLDFGGGNLGTHATWDPAMACGNAAGEAAHSSASLKRVSLLDLLRASDTISSLSSTSLSRAGDDSRSVATATMTAGRLNLADGKIKLQVLQPAKLTTSMGRTSGGAVAYQPALVKVSWPGGKSKTLATAGDSVDISLSDKTESMSTLSELPKLDGLLPGSALPLPNVPGVPSLGMPQTESAPTATDGIKVHIALGSPRRASKGHAIAAKAAAIEIAISEGSSDEESGRVDSNKSDNNRGKAGYGDVSSSSLIAQMSLGLLETAAVAPETVPGKAGGVAASSALPITGPQAGLLAFGGAGLLLAGGLTLLLSRRRRRTLS